MAGSATKYFDRLLQYKVIVCRECKYAVWPNEVEAHLKGSHHQIRDVQLRQKITTEIQSWSLHKRPDQVYVPLSLAESIPELSVHDRLLCRLDPDNCQYIALEKKTMKDHWRILHNGWNTSNSHQRGQGLTKQQKTDANQRFNDATEKVKCQQLFPNRYCCRYFRTQAPTEPEAVPDPWTRITINSRGLLQDRIRRAAEQVLPGEKDDIAPWLERTGWATYLKRDDDKPWNREQLLQLIAKPYASPDSTPEEQIAQRQAELVWNTMGDVCRISQESVRSTGLFIRMEAVRKEHHQDVYKPLETYWDPDSIKKRSRPWQQIMMFFIRTQQEHDWHSPEYVFTKNQFDALFELLTITDDEVKNTEMREASAEEDGTDTPKAIHIACLDFCIELLNHEIVQSEYESALVCALAVLGLTDDGWQDPDTYPPILSAVIKCSRLMVVQKAVLMGKPAVAEDGFNRGTIMDLKARAGRSDGQETDRRLSRLYGTPTGHQNRHQSPGLSPSSFRWSSTSPARISGQRGRGIASTPTLTASSSGASSLKLVEEMISAFMVRGTRTPIQWMLDLRTYGLSIHYSTTAEGHVDWIDGDTLQFKSAEFTMATFREFVMELVREAKGLLMDELLFCDGDRRDELPDVPWHTIRDNPADTTPWFNFLRDKRTVLPVDGTEWLCDRISNDKTLKAEFERLDFESGVDRERVRKYMVKAIKFRELMLILMLITGGQPARGTEMLSIKHSNTAKGLRNVFIEDGLVAFATTYHKGYVRTAKENVVHRYVPREVGELVVWYLWLVLPFQQRMELLAYKDSADINVEYIWPRDPGGKKWTTDRLTTGLKLVTSEGLGHALTTRDYRQIAIAISRKFLRNEFPSDGADKDDEDDVWDLQAGHSSGIADAVYARTIREMASTFMSMRQKYRTASTDWYRYLCFESVIEQQRSRKRKLPFDKHVDDQRRARWMRLRRLNANKTFQQMIGKEVSFRGVQRQAVDAIKAGISPVVAVMPTGAGKSVLFMLPAWAEPGGTTIVVVPLIALRQDMMRRCKKLGIRCVEWNSRRSAGGETIVLVTPESAVSPDFMSYINRLKAARQLDRIVIDECHVVLNDQGSFRTKLQTLGSLVAAETQMVLLTATLPPSAEKTLWDRMSWNEDEVVLLRMPTARKNVRYTVVRPPGKPREDEHDDVVAGLVQGSQGKTIVYCNSRVRVKRLVESGLFECIGFHGKMSRQDKEEALRQFRTGEIGVVVSTSALGMGVDIPDIRTIIHADEPRNMLDYAQESGRAGRDGKKSTAILVTGEFTTKDALVQRFMKEGECCRRIVMDGYLDGIEGRERCEDDEERCDECELEEIDEEGDGPFGSSTGCEDETRDGFIVEDERQQEEDKFEGQARKRARIHQRRIESTRLEARDILGLAKTLDEWKRICIVCHGLGGDYASHIITNCRQYEESRHAAATVKAERVKVPMENFSGCWKCMVPKEICERWEADRHGKWRDMGRPCQYYGIVTSMVFGLEFGHASIHGRWISKLQAAGVDVACKEALSTWLGLRRVKEGVEGSNIIWEFIWIARQVEQRAWRDWEL